MDVQSKGRDEATEDREFREVIESDDGISNWFACLRDYLDLYRLSGGLRLADI